MKYTNEFKEVVEFCKTNNLFVGYGNPNSKILIVGKEHYFPHSHEVNTEAFFEEVLEARKSENFQNVKVWKENIESNFNPSWQPQDTFSDNSNPLTAWWNQRNIPNRLKKNGEWNGGTSNTYLHYQKIYQNVFLEGIKQEKINFQKGIFLSEMNDLPSKESYRIEKLNSLRNEFIEARKELFRQPFFRNFPVVVIASGPYVKEHNFDIQEIFDVVFYRTVEIGKSWYNVHFSRDHSRIVIHTRQLSTSVPNELTLDLSQQIKDFLELLVGLE